MSLKLLTVVAATGALLATPILYAQQTNPEQPAVQPTTETPQAQTPATPQSETSTESDATAATASADAPVEEPLIDQYKLRKDKNFKAIEFELAKELAVHRGSALLLEQESQLYNAAVQNVTSALGSVSEPQKQETYFEYEEDPDTGAFVVALVKDSYVKASRGDVCQIETQVFMRTSIQDEFSAKLATLTPEAAATSTEAAAEESQSSDTAATTEVATKPPTQYTEIECYNDERPTYSQRLVN